MPHTGDVEEVKRGDGAAVVVVVAIGKTRLLAAAMTRSLIIPTTVKSI